MFSSELTLAGPTDCDASDCLRAGMFAHLPPLSSLRQHENRPSMWTLGVGWDDSHSETLATRTTTQYPILCLFEVKFNVLTLPNEVRSKVRHLILAEHLNLRGRGIALSSLPVFKAIVASLQRIPERLPSERLTHRSLSNP